MHSLKINPSAYFVFGAGVLLLFSLLLLPEGQLMPWIAAKILYGIGTLLFIFNK